MIKLNGNVMQFGTYPNNECFLVVEGIKRLVWTYEAQSIVWHYESDSEIFKLIVLKRYLDEIGTCKINLTVPYFPYSRMDRTKDIMRSR